MSLKDILERIVSEVVFKAVGLAAEKSEVTIRVNPEDFEYIEKLRPEFFAKFSELRMYIADIDDGGYLGRVLYRVVQKG